MIFEQIVTGGCEHTCTAAVIDPEISQIDRYLALAAHDRLRIRSVIDTHTCCEFGRISTLAAAALRVMGFQRAVALEGGMKAWREAGYPLQRRSNAS